ncbi:TAXI family TRAP transporter solute-binding subunit [Dongia sedimenti]|uniref:TAXI family TRAP transporter solute-binding subunit n=1 Tax=Dongia sedimenti TaxID=3064282 RepID=A0ABU0YJJ0_9PROT|nr:TAXI family TRAP transporter solute-binding subunit [Rhodospirillaceae bacterium R-7]
MTSRTVDIRRLLKRPLAGASALRLDRRRVLLGLGAAAIGGTGFGALRLFSSGLSGVSDAVAQDINYFRIGGGGVGSRLYQLAGSIAGAITNPPGAAKCDEKSACGVPGLVGLAQTTSGSVENLQSLHEGAIESAVAQADVAAEAMAGEEPFKRDAAQAELRALARIGAAQVQVLVAGTSKAKSLADLKGKTIGFGPKLRDSAVTGPMVLAAYGITPKRAKFTFDEMQPTIAALVDGEIDALIMSDGVPNPDIAALRYSADARLLPIDGAPAQKLIARHGFIKATIIENETYKGLPAIATLEVPILWTVADTLDPKLAYDLAKALASQSLAAGDKSPIDFALAENTGPLALHPGAQRFYDEHRAGAASTN